MRNTLKKAMERRGLKGKDLAAALGWQASKLSRIVKGWVDPTFEDRKRLAAALNTYQETLFPELATERGFRKAMQRERRMNL